MSNNIEDIKEEIKEACNLLWTKYILQVDSMENIIVNHIDKIIKITERIK